jgi:hypothetical protein
MLGAFQQNNQPKERNTNDLFEARTMKSVLLDAMLKYNGWVPCRVTCPELL